MLQLVKSTDTILKNKCQEFDFGAPPFDPVNFSKELVETMYKYNGIGLSASQIGQPYKIFAMRGMSEDFVLFNTRIIDVSEEKSKEDEGCLSYGGIILNIERPMEIKVRFEGPDGQTYTKHFAGMSSRVVQHEMDHGEGIPFIKKVSKLKAEMAIKKTNKNYNTKYVYHELVRD